MHGEGFNVFSGHCTEFLGIKLTHTDGIKLTHTDAGAEAASFFSIYGSTTGH